MSDNKTPVDVALDLLLYAPIGLVLEARNLVPQLAERGRQQLTMARMVGQFAVQQGQTEAGKRLSGLSSLLGQRDEAPAAAGNGRAAAATDGGEAGGPPPPDEPVSARSAPDDTALAIHDYDSLSASQVVPRLAGLSPDELEAVRAYEAETRGRKTILSRIAQLQA